MSQIFYCDGCGVRLMPQESPLGSAGTAQAGDTLCQKCRAARAAEAIKLAPPPQHVGSRPPTGSVTTQASHRRPVPALETTRQPGSNTVVIASVAAGVLLLGGGAFLLMNHTTNAPEPRQRAKAQEEKHSAAQAPVPQPPVPPPPSAAPQSKTPAQSAEERAQDAFAALQKFEGLDPNDAAGKIRRLEAFIELYGDAMVTARARVQLAELKRQAHAAERPPATANPKVSSPAEEAGQSALAFKEDFEGAGASCIRFGEVAGQLPGNAPGKALKFLPNHGRDDELRGGFNVDAYPASARKEQGYLCVLRADAVLRFRYYAENATELRIRINSKGDKESWMKTLDSISLGTWTSVSIPMREFKASGGGADISNGTLCAEFFATAFGKKGLAVYWDDVEITTPDK